mgnify:CR=1 FL=1|jgi:hypothetical protein
MKVGDLVQHTPEKDLRIGSMFPDSDFKIGLIIDENQTNTEQYFWIMSGNKKGWYRRAELSLIRIDNESKIS